MTKTPTAAPLQHDEPLREFGQRTSQQENVFSELFGADRLALVQRSETAFDRNFNTHMISSIGDGAWGRQVLDRPTLSIATLSLLAGMGRFEQFESHVRLAVTVNKVPPVKIVELILHLTMYCGMPVGTEMMKVTRKVFKELGVDFKTLTLRSEGEAKASRSGDKT